jgi:DNA-binding transcriptional LysR family regulator
MAAAPTFDQLRVFVAVVDCGSFSAAARQLNRTQSVVSYTIASLEAQLALPLFERGHRRPVLTEAGTAVLADARRVVGTMEDLCARAAALTQGLEAELAIAVDVMFPIDDLVETIEAFAQAFPTVSLRLRVEALGGVAELVLSGECSLGITGWNDASIERLWRRAIGEVALLPVAAPTHPLAHIRNPIATTVLREHIQLVLSDRSKLTEGRDFGVYALRTWRLGDLGAKHALLRAGLGWGNMPEPTIRDDLNDGRLVRLELEEREPHSYAFLLIRCTQTRSGPAALWLADRFATRSRPVATISPAA